MITKLLDNVSISYTRIVIDNSIECECSTVRKIEQNRKIENESRFEIATKIKLHFKYFYLFILLRFLCHSLSTTLV